MKKNSSSNTFLVEIIIVLLFFGICAAIVTQVFVQAYLKNELSENSNIAIIKAQSIAEEISAIDINSESKIIVALKDGKNTQRYDFSYSEKWEECNCPTRFSITINVTENILEKGIMLDFNIIGVDLKDDTELCSISSKKYIGI